LHRRRSGIFKIKRRRIKRRDREGERDGEAKRIRTKIGRRFGEFEESRADELLVARDVFGPIVVGNIKGVISNLNNETTNPNTRVGALPVQRITIVERAVAKTEVDEFSHVEMFDVSLPQRGRRRNKKRDINIKQAIVVREGSTTASPSVRL